MDKPTGHADCPPYIDRAHAIEEAMNEKGGSRDLDDDKIVNDAISISSGDSDDDDDNPPSPKKKALVKSEPGTKAPIIARCSTSDCLPSAPLHQHCAARGAGQEFLANISSALDPSVHAQRGEERAARALQASQVFSLTSQLRESQNLVENLRHRLTTAEREHNDAERCADRAELLSMMSGSRHPTPPASRHPDRCQHEDTYYAGGGQATRWVGGSDEEEYWFQRHSDSPETPWYTNPAVESTPPRLSSSCEHPYASPSNAVASSSRIHSTPFTSHAGTPSSRAPYGEISVTPHNNTGLSFIIPPPSSWPF